jgi:hypothetical protein
VATQSGFQVFTSRPPAGHREDRHRSPGRPPALANLGLKQRRPASPAHDAPEHRPARFDEQEVLGSPVTPWKEICDAGSASAAATFASPLVGTDWYTTRAWPPTLAAPPHWDQDFTRAAASAAVTLSLDEAVAEVTTWIDAISHA